MIRRRLVPSFGSLRIPRSWFQGTPTQRIHAVASQTGLSYGRSIANSSVHSVQRLLWDSRYGRRQLKALNPRWPQKYAEFLGVEISEQQDVLHTLVRTHGVSPIDAYWYNLVSRERYPKWPTYVFQSERHWNLAASEILLGSRSQAAAALALMGDKHATDGVLRAHGIASPDSVLCAAGGEITTHDLSKWREQWGELYAKPRFGSRGIGGFRIEDGDGPDHIIINGVTATTEQAAAQLSRAVRRSDYLIQPLLRTLELAQANDVVTLRIVTRSLEQTPHVFSSVLEWPARSGVGHEIFDVESEGRVGPSVIPAWLPMTNPSQSRPPTTHVEGIDVIRSAAIEAHAAVGGLFAIAWDVALSQDGPLFLEGNGGFGTRSPQATRGGILPEH